MDIRIPPSRSQGEHDVCWLRHPETWKQVDLRDVPEPHQAVVNGANRFERRIGLIEEPKWSRESNLARTLGSSISDTIAQSITEREANDPGPYRQGWEFQ